MWPAAASLQLSPRLNDASKEELCLLLTTLPLAENLWNSYRGCGQELAPSSGWNNVFIQTGGGSRRPLLRLHFG